MPSIKTKIPSKKSNKKSYKVIFIDWNGTLSGSKFWGHLESTDSRLFQAVESSLFGKLRQLLKPWMRGEVDSEKVIREIAVNSGLPYKKILNEFIKSCQQMEFVSPEVPLLITNLRKSGAKVAIATDNMDSFCRWTVPAMRLDCIFDEILSSYSLKGMKKDISSTGESVFFSRFMEEENLKPGESLLIDDSKDDMITIQGFGIDYMQVELITGLVPALRSLLSST